MVQFRPVLAFYRWHQYIDDRFQIHKNKLPPYTEEEIGYDNITISSIAVQSDGKNPSNTFKTFWQQSDVDLSRGMDFLPRGNIYARFVRLNRSGPLQICNPFSCRFKHLQHTPFTYTLNIKNEKGTAARGTVRIFMAPKFDENNKEWLFKEQRLLMIEMDRFTVNCNRQFTFNSIFEWNSFFCLYFHSEPRREHHPP